MNKDLPLEMFVFVLMGIPEIVSRIVFLLLVNLEKGMILFIRHAGPYALHLTLIIPQLKDAIVLMALSSSKAHVYLFVHLDTPETKLEIAK